MRITLIATVHAESGRANIAELRAILDRLAPDVIFAEIPSAFLADYLNGSHGTLESAAVVLYRERRPVNVVPVDLDKPGEEFFSNSEDMFKKVARTSTDYRRLVDQNSLDMLELGFPYLNSDRCAQAWEGICNEALATVEWIDDTKLRQTYDLWNQTNADRETGMIENIESYCIRHVPAHGVFLVGAAHRKPIMEKVRKRQVAGGPGVFWDF
ncbi:MAG: hypothetical protein PSV26_19795 [Polaromonas sp.]|uniref:hypothetical protein n=1 Tax=Polaromonas sp. TaxID=1869339 RepID=UPI00248A5798|nr:hypothetical protein [Polaromonas sp.]MDI1239731.1 hypothetical protein [Polaromonas sp.]